MPDPRGISSAHTAYIQRVRGSLALFTSLAVILPSLYLDPKAAEDSTESSRSTEHTECRCLRRVDAQSVSTWAG